MTKIQVRKQFTTTPVLLNWGLQLFSIWRRYKFESNSQRLCIAPTLCVRCFQYDEDTSSKAIHNRVMYISLPGTVVFNMTKIQVRKQFTTISFSSVNFSVLFSIWRRYKFESNSQRRRLTFGWEFVVFNMTKIQVRKQFTTKDVVVCKVPKLFSIWRRYKFESNSQPVHAGRDTSRVVFNMTKIQVRKQFTTGLTLFLSSS